MCVCVQFIYRAWSVFTQSFLKCCMSDIMIWINIKCQGSLFSGHIGDVWFINVHKIKCVISNMLKSTTIGCVLPVVKGLITNKKARVYDV